MRRGSVLSALMLVVLLHASPAWATAFTFESLFDPTANRLDVTIDVVDIGDILPGTFGILGFDFDISFNPAILSGDPLLAIDAQPGNFLSRIAFPFLVPLGDPATGSLTIISALLGPVPAGATLDGTLATISFLNVNPGLDPNVVISNLHLSRLIVPDAEFPLVDSVDVAHRATVPEPSSLALVALGLIALRRRKERRTKN